MAIIKTKSIYNVKNIHLIHHGYRTVASILELTVLINFAFSLTIRTQKKNAYQVVHNKRILLYIDNWIFEKDCIYSIDFLYTDDIFLNELKIG